MRWACFAFHVFVAHCLPSFGDARDVTKNTLRTLRSAKTNLPHTFNYYERAEGRNSCSQMFVLPGLPKPVFQLPTDVLERAVQDAADKLDGLFEQIAQHFPEKIAGTMRAMYLGAKFVTFDLESTDSFFLARRAVTNAELRIAAVPVSLRRGFANSKVSSRIILLTLSVRAGFFLLQLRKVDSAEVSDSTATPQQLATAYVWAQMQEFAIEHSVHRLVPDIHIGADLQLNVPDGLLITQYLSDRKFYANTDLRSALSSYVGPKYFHLVEDIDAEVGAFLEIWDSE